MFSRLVKTYAVVGFGYNGLLLSMTRINYEDPDFKKQPSFYYRKIFCANMFRILCFPYSIFEYYRYPKIRSLSYPPNKIVHEDLSILYRLEYLYELEEDLTMKDAYLELYMHQRRLIYQ